MKWILKRFAIFFAMFIAFCLAGYLASSIENLHESLLASTAVFGVSFLSLIGGAFKLWHSIFG